MKWFRFYSEFKDDIKVQVLSEAYQRRLVMLFCMKSGNGSVTLQNSDVTFQLRISTAEWEQTKAVFVERGFIDQDNNILNWDKRQYVSDSSNSRVAAFRERNKKQKRKCNVTVTKKKRPQITDTDTDIYNEESYLILADRYEIGITLNDKSTHHPLISEIDNWKKFYPGVNVEQQIREIAAWSLANPKNAKTKSGVNRFINAWLTRAQNNSGKPQSAFVDFKAQAKAEKDLQLKKFLNHED